MIDGRLIRRESGITSTARTKSRINVQEIEENYHEQKRKGTQEKKGKKQRGERESLQVRKENGGITKEKKNMYVVYKSPATWYTQGRSRHKHL